MEFGGASSIVLLMAAALWLAYIVPSLVRRRAYEATERNAVRLQQTLRALAETAEGPAELRVETTGRSVASQQRAVRQAKRAAEQAEQARDAAAAKSLPRVATPKTAADRRRAMAATRRGRLVTTITMTLGLAAAGAGVWFGLQSGVWWLLVAGVVTVLGALAMLQRLARVADAQRLAASRCRAQAEASARESAAPAAPSLQQLPTEPVVDFPLVAETAEPASAAGWTPVAVPRPLYLSRSTAEPVTPDGPDGPDGPNGAPIDRTVTMEALRDAARRSEQAVRDAHAGALTFARVASGGHGAMSDVSADTMPFARATLVQAAQLEPIEAPAGATLHRASVWSTMGVVADADARTEGAPLRRRAS